MKFPEKQKQVIDFLVEHPDFFINHMSGCYPLSAELLKKHANKLNWGYLSENENLPWSIDFFKQFEDYWWWNEENEPYASCVLNNPKIPWSIEFIELYKKKLDWEYVSQMEDNFDWTLEIIEKFKDKLWWEWLSKNEGLPWSSELIDKYEDKWDWEGVSGNKGIPWSAELRKRYNSKLNIDKFLEKDINYFEEIRKLYPSLCWHLDPDNHETGLFTQEEMAEILDKPDWRRMSFNERIPWTDGLIDYYKDEWDWEELSRNPSLPWSEHFIDKYIDIWEWGHMNPCEDGDEIITGLSCNDGLPWSSKLINRYLNRWFWYELSYNEGIPWSLEVINEFYNKWEWRNLTWNTAMWKKVFYPHLNENTIDQIMTKIKESNLTLDK